MPEKRRVSPWRTLFSFGWRHWEMPHPRRTWVVLYLACVLGLAGASAVIGINGAWAFLAGGLVAVSLMAAVEARYRRRHPPP
jgi:hypothetical protein